MATKNPKRTVRQNRWGNWRGYSGGKFVREFASDSPGFLFSGAAQCGSALDSTEMPEEARQWLAEAK